MKRIMTLCVDQSRGQYRGFVPEDSTITAVVAWSRSDAIVKLLEANPEYFGIQIESPDD